MQIKEQGTHMNIKSLLMLLLMVCSLVPQRISAMDNDDDDNKQLLQQFAAEAARAMEDNIKRRQEELARWEQTKSYYQQSKIRCKNNLDDIERRIRNAESGVSRESLHDLRRERDRIVVELAEAEAKVEEYSADINQEREFQKTTMRMAEKGWGTIFDTVSAKVKTDAEREAATEKAAVDGYWNTEASKDRWNKILEFASQPKKLVAVAGAISLAAAGIYGAKEGSRVLANYVASILGRPSLVKDSSRDTFWNRVKIAILGKPPIKHNINEVIVKPTLEEKLRFIAVATKAARKNGDPLTNLLFYGPPGTGKTMYAKSLAEYVDFDYAIMSGADFSQFKEGDDITELHKLFDWAEHSTKPLVVFVDEADSFLRNRGWATTSQKSINLTNAFLSRVEKQTSDKIMFVFATNHPEVLDPAVLSRIGEKVEFTLPDLEERKAQFALYLKKYVTNKKMTVDASVEQQMTNLAQAMHGLAGRDIDGMVVKMVKKMRIADTKVLTADIAMQVIKETTDEKQKEVGREHKSR